MNKFSFLFRWNSLVIQLLNYLPIRIKKPNHFWKFNLQIIQLIEKTINLFLWNIYLKQSLIKFSIYWIHFWSHVIYRISQF